MEGNLSTQRRHVVFGTLEALVWLRYNYNQTSSYCRNLSFNNLMYGISATSILAYFARSPLGM